MKRASQTPNLVIGYPDTVSCASCGAASASCLVGPRAVTLDRDGNFFVADSHGHRILEFPKSNPKTAIRVWGQDGKVLFSLFSERSVFMMFNFF